MSGPADQYTRLVESSPDGILVIRNSRIEFLNPAAVRLFGASDPAEILGKSPFDLLHGNSHHVISQRFEQLLRGETLAPIEEQVVRLDGRVVDVEVNSTLPGDGTIQMIVRDIGERKRRESALRESEERLMLAFAGAQEGVWDWNLETGAVVYSPRWKQMLGYGDDEIPANVSAWEQLLHPDDRTRAEALNDAVAQGRPTYEGEFRLRHKEGHYITVLTRGLPIRRRATVRSCASSARISTSPSASAPRRRCARARSACRSPLPARRRASGTGTSRRMPCVYSSRWKQMLGYDDDEIESHISAWERLVHPDDRAIADQAHESVARGQPTYEAEFRLRHKDGHYVQILSRGFPVRREPGGPVVRIVGTHFDLTERKKREAEHARTELLAHLVFVQEDERRRIARDMHDQFGEQLTTLSLRIALLRDACGERPDLASHVDALDGDRATARSRRRRARLAAPADGPRRPRPARGAGQLHPGMGRAVQRRRGAAHLGPARRPPRLGSGDRALSNRPGSAQQRRQALARPARRGDPRAAARLRAAHCRGRRRRVLRGGRRQGAAAGIGLVGMQERAALVGATLEIESTPGQGHDRPRADGGAGRRPPDGRPCLSEPAALRVILADDHVTVRHGLKLLIDSQADMKVVGRGERRRGRRSARRSSCKPDVIVMDISMPGMNGLAATRALQEVAARRPDRHADAPCRRRLSPGVAQGRGLGLRAEAERADGAAARDPRRRGGRPVPGFHADGPGDRRLRRQAGRARREARGDAHRPRGRSPAADRVGLRQQGDRRAARR